MKRLSIPKFLGLAILPLAALAVLAGSYFHAFDNYELETLDMRFRLRPQIPTTDKVAIIEIGDDTIAKIGRFPFDRSYHAILVKALADAGAKAIVFDLFFSEPHKADAEFAEAVKKAGNVYFPAVFELKGGSGGVPKAAGYIAKNLGILDDAAKGVGHINVIPDIDGKFRRAPAHIEYGGRMYPYLSLKVAQDYLGLPEGRMRIPLDENSLILVNFSGPWHKTYSHYSYVDILQSYLARVSGEKPNTDLAEFKGKVCIIGLTAVGTVDLHPNPFDTLYPAVGMHAEVFNSIVNNNFIRRASRGANLIILVFLCAAMAALVLKTKPLRGLVIMFSVIAAYCLSCILAFDLFGVWVDIFYPVSVIVLLHLSITLYKYMREWKHRLLMENELGIAKKIQESFLPKAMPAVGGVDVAARMFTARQVGGDLYDFVSFGDGKFGIMAGDVSGKGVPAALFMAMSVGAFRSFAMPGAAPERVLADLNTKLVRESASNLFVTVFYMIFDMRSGAAAYANGGHLPVLYLPKSGTAQFLDVKDGAPLGLMDGEYSGGRVAFGAGDTFVFYTDGITEAMNARSDMYGKDRLQAVCGQNRSLGAKRLVEEIEKDVRRFEPKSQQHDDMTIIAVKIT